MKLLRAFVPAAFGLMLSGSPARAEGGLSCNALPELIERLFENHVEFRKESEALLARVVDVYLQRLDGLKTLLLQSEADAMKVRIRGFLEEVSNQRCDTLEAIHQELYKRHQETEAIARRILSDPKLQIDRTIKLQTDSDKRDRPKTMAEREELVRKFIHFQLANSVTAGTTLEEARKKVLHRYELSVKRLKDLKLADRYAVFLDAFANAMDPHTSYLSAKQLEDFSISMQLSLEGIGAVLTSEDGMTVVREVVAGGAAEKQGGLKPKDKIMAVAQEKGDPVDVTDEDLSDVVRLIRGKKGTIVRLTVLRQTDKTETHQFDIVRDKIDLKEQAAKLRWEKVDSEGRSLNLAVIELPSFYGGREAGARQCTDDVATLLKEVNEKKADGLVFDLSRNGGGLLQHAVTVTGLFLRAGNVVGVEGPRASRQLLEDMDPTTQFRGPMVVLTSRVSASASEIVAGALRDYKRAVILGDGHTFGKGSVQNVIDQREGLGAIKVTTAMFFRPGGESTQHKGVEVDVEVPSIFNTDEFGEKTEDYSLPPKRIEPFLSPGVNDGDPDRRWKPVTGEMAARLRSRSAERVAKVEAFAEVQKEIEKGRRNRGEVALADILDGRVGDAGKDDEDDPEKKNELTPQAREALNVLADLVTAAATTAQK